MGAMAIWRSGPEFADPGDFGSKRLPRWSRSAACRRVRRQKAAAVDVTIVSHRSRPRAGALPTVLSTRWTWSRGRRSTSGGLCFP